MPEPAPLLALEAVDAGYGALQVLWGVRLHVRHGEIVSLIGPNGAGKTTVIKAILGLVPLRRRPAGGAIRFKGGRIDGLAPEQVVRRGYVLEQGRVVLEDAGPALLESPHVRLSYLGV